MAGSARQFDHDLIRLREHAINYNDFLRLHGPFIRRIAEHWHRLCGGHVDVDDLYQDSLEAVWRAVDRYKPQLGVPLKFWVSKCLRHKLQKCTTRARKLPHVERSNVEHFGGRNPNVADDFLANAEQVTRFRRRLAKVVGSVPPSTGALVYGIARGRGVERTRQEVFAEYTIGGAIRKSRVAMRQALKVAERLED